MNAHAPPRGGAPVGYLRELDPVGAAAVLCLRLWCDGPEGQAQVRRDFATVFGVRGGRRVLASLEKLCALCLRHGRRPLMRHAVTCKCLGADESWFASFIGYASEGERDDALLIAMTIVRPDIAPSLVGHAQVFGLALRRMSLRCRPGRGVSETVH